MRHLLLALVLAGVCTLVAPARSAEAGPFDQGNVRVSIIAGYGQTFGNNYLIAGAGLGYFLIDGLELGARYEGWFLSDPRINKLSPGLEYVFHFVPVVQPFVGGFYRYWLLSGDFDNFSTLGVRGGLYLSSVGPLLISLGAVHERVVGSCEAGCSMTYPEIRLSFSF